MRWTNALNLLAVAALVACSDATAVETPSQHRGRGDLVPSGDPALLTAIPSVAITSVRTIVPGFFYAARGTTSDNTDVHIIVRSQPASTGFANLTSGTLVQDEIRTSGGEMTFSASTGNRYLVIVAPSPGNVDDLSHASYVEFAL